MQCKIKKVTKYNVEGYDITINVSPEELDELRAIFGCWVESPEITMILDTINKELNK